MTDERLDEHAPEPLHYQLQRIFTSKINSGEWPAGHRLDGEFALSDRYGVSRATMRQAILALVAKGYLTRKQGRGTFVAEKKHDFSVIAPRISETTAESRHALLDLDVRVHDEEVAELLGVPASTWLTRIERLRYLEGEPISIEISYLASGLCPGIEKADMAIPLVDILAEDYDVRIATRTATVEPVLLDPVQKERLHFSGDPALGLLVTRTGYSEDGSAMTVDMTTFRGDRYRALVSG